MSNGKLEANESTYYKYKNNEFEVSYLHSYILTLLQWIIYMVTQRLGDVFFAVCDTQNG